MKSEMPLLTVGERGRDGVVVPLPIVELAAELRASERVGDTPGTLDGIVAARVGTDLDKGEDLWEVTVKYQMRFKR